MMNGRVATDFDRSITHKRKFQNGSRNVLGNSPEIGIAAGIPHRASRASRSTFEAANSTVNKVGPSNYRRPSVNVVDPGRGRRLVQNCRNAR